MIVFQVRISESFHKLCWVVLNKLRLMQTNVIINRCAYSALW